MKKTEIDQIPKLSETMTALEIGERFGYHENTIRYWARRLRERGEVVEFRKLKVGRKSLI